MDSTIKIMNRYLGVVSTAIWSRFNVHRKWPRIWLLGNKDFHSPALGDFFARKYGSCFVVIQLRIIFIISCSYHKDCKVGKMIALAFSMCLGSVCHKSQPSLDQALVEYSQYTHCRDLFQFAWKYITLFWEKKTGNSFESTNWDRFYM